MQKYLEKRSEQANYISPQQDTTLSAALSCKDSAKVELLLNYINNVAVFVNNYPSLPIIAALTSNNANMINSILKKWLSLDKELLFDDKSEKQSILHFFIKQHLSDNSFINISRAEEAEKEKKKENNRAKKKAIQKNKTTHDPATMLVYNVSLETIRSLSAQTKDYLRDSAGHNIATFICKQENCLYLLNHLIQKNILNTADFMEITPKGNNLLHELLLVDHDVFPIYQFLIDIIKIPYEHKNADGETPLIAAVYAKKWFAVKCLLQYEANITTEDNQGIRPIDALLNAWHLRYITIESNTVLPHTQMYESDEHKILTNYIDKLNFQEQSILQFLKASKEILILFNLLCVEKNANPQSPRSIYNLSLLHMSAFCISNVESWIKFIKSSSLNINEKSYNGNSLLATLIKNKFTEKALSLIKKCSTKLTKLDNLNSSVLHLACQLGDHAFLSNLEPSFKDKFIENMLIARKDGKSPFDLALHGGHKDIIVSIWSKFNTEQRSLVQNKANSIELLMLHEIELEPQIIEYYPIIDPSNESPSPCFSSSDEESLCAHETISSLSPIAQPFSLLPLCYTSNEFLRDLLDKISENIQDERCEAYLYGSAHYKLQPNDFDILIPDTNIYDRTDQTYINAFNFIAKFINQGGICTINNYGSIGYHKENRYTVPMSWQNFKLEFVLVNYNYTQHASLLDFTLGAIYYDLRNKNTLIINGLTPRYDAKNKILKTIIDPLRSLQHDLRRVFRAIRLIVFDGYKLDQPVAQAIQEIFTTNVNPLLQMNKDRLNYQLQKIFHHENYLTVIEVLQDLKILPHLIAYWESHPNQDFEYLPIYPSIAYMSKFMLFSPMRNVAAAYSEFAADNSLRY